MRKQIYLARHGDSPPGYPDHHRPLSSHGIHSLEAVAKKAKEAGAKPYRIFHSGYKRAEESADIFAKILIGEDAIVKPTPHLAPEDEPALWSNDQLYHGLMLVGHNPFMSKFLLHLTFGGKQYGNFVFEPGTIVCLEQEKHDHIWSLRWHFHAS